MTDKDCPERRDVAWLEKMITRMIDDHDKKMEERFKGEQRAIEVYQENNMHWKALAEARDEQTREIIKKMNERERDFFPRLTGYIVTLFVMITFVMSLYSFFTGD
jgi:hypothetical protein